MVTFVAALPMYDWPEVRDETDALWVRLRDRLRAGDVDAPERLARRNADLPAVPGGIRDAAGVVIAPDPATLPPDELDLATLCRHPDLLLAQTCWGPMELGLSVHVAVVGQPGYDGIEGGQGEYYSSALLMRREDLQAPPPLDGRPHLSLDRLRGGRFAFNGPDSMSGIIALTRDLETMGEGLAIFSHSVQTGSHRASIRAVAAGQADVCAVDCRAWALARRFEPAAERLVAVGWTARRMGLPYVTSRHTPPALAASLRRVLAAG